MAKFTFTGNVYIQMGAETKPAAIPMSFSFDYSEKCITDNNWTTNQTNAAVPQGTVDAPRVVMVEVLEGSLELATNNTGAGAIALSANPTPQAGDPPAVFMFFTFAPEATQFYVTTTAPARARISLFG